MDKRLKELSDIMFNDVVSKKDIEVFLSYVLNYIAKSKEEVIGVSQEVKNEIDKTLEYFLSEKNDFDAEFKKTIQEKKIEIENEIKMSNDIFSDKVEELSLMIEKVKRIKTTPGKDGYTPIKGVDYFDGQPGKDAVFDSSELIKELISEIPKPQEYELSGVDVVNVINDLPVEVEYQIDARHIKNLPEMKASTTSRLLSKLYDVSVTNVTNGQTLIWNSTTNKWEAGASGTPGGSNKKIQYNDNGVFGGFGEYDKVKNLVSLQNTYIDVNATNAYYFNVVDSSTGINSIYCIGQDIYFGDKDFYGNGAYFAYTGGFYFDFYGAPGARVFEVDLGAVSAAFGDIDYAFGGDVMGIDGAGGVYNNPGHFFIGTSAGASIPGVGTAIVPTFTIDSYRGRIDLYESNVPASGDVLLGNGTHLSLTPLYNAKTKTANYTLSASADEMIICTTNSFDITFPTAVGFIRQFTVINIGATTITLKTTSSQTISGSASGTLTLTQWKSITVRSDGSNWVKVAGV